MKNLIIYFDCNEKARQFALAGFCLNLTQLGRIMSNTPQF